MNHAGASPSPDIVVDRVIRHLRLEQSSGGYAAAARVQDELEGVYDKIALMIHAESASTIALVESATVGWTRLFYAAAEQAAAARRQQQQGGRFILISQAEYAANVVAACQWARQHEGWNVLCIPSERAQDGRSNTGKVDLHALQNMLQGRYEYRANADSTQIQKAVLNPDSIAIICITHVPTNSGIVNPVYEIGRLIDAFNKNASKKKTSESDKSIFYLVDACQSVGQMDVNVQAMKCHGLVATGRKYLRGPRGTGFLYSSAPESLTPNHIDHYSTPIANVPKNNSNNVSLLLPQEALPLQDVVSFAPRKGARRFEFWESSIANRLGLGCAVEAALAMGLEQIAAIIQQRAEYLYHNLQQLQQQQQLNKDRHFRKDLIQLHHSPESGIVTFWVRGIESAILKCALWEGDEQHGVKFEVSVVPATSTPIDSATTGVPDLLRASVSYTTTTQEIDLFCERIGSLIDEIVVTQTSDQPSSERAKS